jgi:hypothetical protein
MSSELRTAVVSIFAGFIGAIIGAIASIGTTYMHLGSERTKLQIQSVSIGQKAFQKKAERLFGETSDLVSFFDTNNTFEIREAKEHIAKARRAVFEFAVYASPEMTFEAANAIEAINIAITAEDRQQLTLALRKIKDTSTEMITLIYKERINYKKQHTELLK